jgi:putative ABC transport system substrate-binding protein
LGAGLLGLALLVCLPAASSIAQKGAVLGYLTNASADPKRIEDVRHAMANLGYVEGKNITIEVRGAKSNEDYDAMAAELVARPVDIIIAVNSAATNAARNATSTILIVMTAVNDPVEWGFVRSLERPGTNVTGTTLNGPQVVGERLQILKRIVHNLDQISMLVVASNAAATLDVVHAKAAAMIVAVNPPQIAMSGQNPNAFSAEYRPYRTAATIAIRSKRQTVTLTSMAGPASPGAKHRRNAAPIQIGAQFGSLQDLIFECDAFTPAPVESMTPARKIVD